MTTFNSQANKILDQQQLHELTILGVQKIDEILEYFGVDLRRESNMYIGSCPIHCGDRDNAFNLYYEGDSVVGNWKCRSHQCENVFMPSFLGFVRGLLSKQKLGWQEEGDDLYPFGDTIQFLVKFLGADLSSLEFKVDKSASDRRNDAQLTMNYFNRQKRKVIDIKINRETVRKTLQIPSKYYVDRGYSEEILDKYDIGICTNTSKPMFNRSVVPIYDDSHEFLIGCTGRSVFEKCEDCKTYHSPSNDCPSKEYKWQHSKWRHSAGFQAEEYLYNMWYAKEHIYKSKCAVLVESPGNVWRLEEAGVKIALGLFGASLSDGQLYALNSCGAMNIVLCMDKDEAGEKGSQTISSKLMKSYNVIVLDINASDIGEMPVSLIKRDVVPEICEACL